MQVILGPEKMITIPPRHYCIVENPVLRDKDGRVLIDANGQIKLGHADQVLCVTQLHMAVNEPAVTINSLNCLICNSNWTEWSTIQGVIVQLISKLDKHKADLKL